MSDYHRKDFKVEFKIIINSGESIRSGHKAFHAIYRFKMDDGKEKRIDIMTNCMKNASGETIRFVE